MTKRRRVWWLAALSCACAASLIAAVACGGGKKDPKTYAVAYAAGASDAVGSVAEERYVEGTPITLRDSDTFEREGYTFTQWSDGKTLYDAGDKYFVEAHDVTFTAQWEKLAPQPVPEGAEQVSEIPAGTLVTANSSARANWFAEYTAAGLKVTAWVKDANVYTDGNIYTNDSVEVIFATVGRKVGYADTDNTISVIVSAKGETLVKNLSTDQTAEIAGLVTTAKVVTVDGTTVAGYRVEITMPYDAAGISEANKNAALLLGFTNASNAGNAKYAYETSLGTESGKLNTFIAVKDDNKFEANSFTELGLFWGNGGGALTAKNSWNLEYDDGVTNQIEMTGLDGDNNIYMRSTNTAEYFAQVQLHVKELRNNDEFPKFGLTIFKTDGTEGLMYFVDARSNGTVINSDSTKLDYVFYDASNRDKWVWKTDKVIGDLSDDLGLGVTSAAYTGADSYITLGIYRHNSDFQFYVGETPLEVITLNGYTSSYAGLASFNILLSAKNYSVNTNAAELATYRKTLEDSKGAKTLDGKLNDWTDEDKANPFELPALDGQSVTVYATKDTKGVYVYYDAYHKTHKTEETEWYLNTNVEFYLGGTDKQYYVSANGTEGNIGKNNYYINTVQGDSNYHTVAEIFIPYAEIVGDYSEDTLVPARFLFKVGGNFGNVWFEGDWWRTDDGNTNQGILITNDGILGASNKTIDADDSDWENATWTAAGRAQWAAALEEDGLYLFIKLTGTIASDRAYFSGADAQGANNNWWLNQNIEIQDNVVSGLKAAKIVYVGGKAYHTAFVNDAAAKYTAGTGNADDKLDFEIFIARENFKDHAARTLTANVGGQLFADATSTENVYQTYISNVAIGAALYTVTYDYKNGSENTTQQVVKGDAVGTLPTPSRTGFTFDGWYDGETKVDDSFVPTDAVTLVAKWNPIAPAITWNNGNVAATGTNPSVTPTYDSAKEVYNLALPATNPYTLTDHSFSKWSVTVQGVAGSKQYNLGETAEIPSGSTVTVTAVWTEVGKTYRTVTFALGYTGAPDYDETRTVEDGLTASDLPTDPTRTGYRFDGWYLSDNTTKFTTTTTVTRDITVTAKWIEQVTVTFNIGYTGGTNPASITLDKDGTITSLPSAGTRTYYEFAGWFYGENNATQLTTSVAVTANLSVTAKWTHKGDKNVEYLFLGDSIISTMADDGTDFYYLWKVQFGNLNAANIGVPGSKALEWVQKINGEEVAWLKNVNLLQYNAQKVIIHVGVNDVNDGSYSDEYVKNQLDLLFKGLKELNPDVEIFYVSMMKNPAFPANTATYESINDWVKTQNGIVFIDVASKISDDMQWFLTDGLHPGVDGYGVFNREIVKALGLSNLYVEEGNGLGDTKVTGAPQFGYTANWQYDSATQIWHNASSSPRNTENKIMISEAYGSTIYAEAKVSVEGVYKIYNRDGDLILDPGSKGGLVISSSTITYFFYIDLAPGNNLNANGHFANNWGSIMYRKEIKGAKNWIAPEPNEVGEYFRPFPGNGYVNLGAGGFDYNLETPQWKTLGIAKVGKALYFFAGEGENLGIVGTLEESEFAENEAVTISVYNFSSNMYAKDGYATTDADEVQSKLPQAAEKTIDGNLNDWTATDKTNPVYIPASDGRSVTVYATMGEGGVYVYYDVWHNTHKMDARDGDNNIAWYLNTNVEFRLGTGATQFFASAASNSDGSKMSNGFADGDYYMNTTQESGKYHTVFEGYIPYTHADLAGIDKDSTSVKGGFAFKVGGETGVAWANGDWWYVPEADPNMRNTIITHNGILTGSEKTLDGNASDWSGLTAAEYSDDNGNHRYASYLGSDGLYLLVEAHRATININGTNLNQGGENDNWWRNTNLEIQNGAGLRKGIVMMFGGNVCHSGFVTDAAMTHTNNGTEDVWTLEVFISNEHLANMGMESAVSMRLGSQIWNNTGENGGNIWLWWTTTLNIAR